MTRALDRLRQAPDPDDAVRRAERLFEAGLDEERVAGTPEARDVLWIACAQAPYLASLATRDVERLLAAAADPWLRRAKPRERMAVELAAVVDGAGDGRDLAARLRAYRAREYVRLGARECGLGDPEEVGRELAHLADVCLEAALRFHDAELERTVGEPKYTAEDGTTRRAELVVMGMGKLGGEELNFSSDIDLIYLYSSDQGRAGSLSLHEYFDRLARRVTRTIGEVTEDDVVFRVDLRLRPEGGRGPLVNSLPSLERYYETWGRPWERQAWLKARPSAGSLALGEEALATLEPFVYPRLLGPDVIRDVEELNRRIKAELAPGTLEDGFDVKVGRGGIREIEFFVQALQLVHAGKNRALRERSTRRALDRLLFAGLVAERERRALADAYAFLRQVEHRLQLEAGRQTHRLPRDVRALGVLARRLGFPDVPELIGTLQLRTRAVAEIFATLGGRESPARRELSVVVGGGDVAAVDDPALRAALAALGFRDPEAAAFHVELLRRKPASPFGPARAGAAARVAAPFLEELCASPDPDQALRFAVDFVAKMGVVGGGYWRLLEENRPVLRLLASLFGTSAFLAKVFVAHPELLDTLLLVGRGGPRGGRDALEAAVTDRLAGLPPDDDEAAWNALRRLKNEELLRIGLADIAGDLELEEVFAQLTDLADVCVARTFDLVAAALVRRGRRLPPLAIVALGKLGAREMGYASDLDLVFVYDGDLDDHEAAAKLAQRLVHALGAVLEEGRLYEVDTRLRPSGQKGTLVSSLASWRAYHARQARLWERQALIRCRAVAGDAALGALLEEEAARFVYAGDLDPEHVAEAITQMRARLERELTREAHGSSDIKAGRGGLLDVEFAAQYLALVHGARDPALRTRSTLGALAAAATAGLLSPADHDVLAEGYRFLRRIENRLRIVHDRPIHEMPSDPVELDKLARRAGFPNPTALDRAYRLRTRAIRACYERLLGGRK